MAENPETRRRIMQSVKSRDTKPEMIVRRLIHGAGYRYRLHRSDLPGKPDLVFSSRRKVIFVHGCFWHGHSCRRGARTPKTNQAYWVKKINGNKERDAKAQKALHMMGWDILIVWECQVKNQQSLINRITKFLKS
jgi:DNA mismatch endonuclease (patch repair protein)